MDGCWHASKERSDEAIAVTGLSLDEARAADIVLQGFTNLANTDLERGGAAAGVVPNSLAQVGWRDQLAGMSDQIVQNRPGLGREAERFFPVPPLASGGVPMKMLERQHGRPV